MTKRLKITRRININGIVKEKNILSPKEYKERYPTAGINTSNFLFHAAYIKLQIGRNLPQRMQNPPLDFPRNFA
jgi:hypothetical protein